MDFFEQLKDFLEEHKKLMVALAVLATIGGSLLIPNLCSLLSSQTEFSMDGQSKSALSSFSANWSNASTISASNSVNSDYVYVDVKGAIKHPGVYKVPNGKRVGDVLSLAGGPLEGADTTQINFAHKLEDQMVIYIPKVGESSPIENTVGVSVLMTKAIKMKRIPQLKRYLLLRRKLIRQAKIKAEMMAKLISILQARSN